MLDSHIFVPGSSPFSASLPCCEHCRPHCASYASRPSKLNPALGEMLNVSVHGWHCLGAIACVIFHVFSHHFALSLCYIIKSLHHEISRRPSHVFARINDHLNERRHPVSQCSGHSTYSNLRLPIVLVWPEGRRPTSALKDLSFFCRSLFPLFLPPILAVRFHPVIRGLNHVLVCIHWKDLCALVFICEAIHKLAAPIPIHKKQYILRSKGVDQTLILDVSVH